MGKKIISIDVGIKNLAYCIMEITTDNKDPHQFNIHQWGIINILDEKLNNCLTCSNYIGNKICGKIICNSVQLPSGEKIGFCDKIRCQKFMINSYEKKQIKKFKKPTCKNTSLLELATILLNKLNNLKIEVPIDEVVIENQPVLKNPTMKSIQMIIFSFFVQNGIINNDSKINNIILFSARNKLKTYDGPKIDASHLKNKYSQRKFLSVEYTKYFIKNVDKWNVFFNSHKKKDDLADCFLQGLHYLCK
uniref:Mitochondrial resolvase Ydc2 catalytic domain-containing protein n=1 Tax=viral metagenome TaxID=1070528 RepID=A0A6C0LYB4_9ZZZZ